MTVLDIVAAVWDTITTWVRALADPALWARAGIDLAVWVAVIALAVVPQQDRP